jgi:hypothetical protein
MLPFCLSFLFPLFLFISHPLIRTLRVLTKDAQKGRLFLPAQKVKQVFPWVLNGAVKDALARSLALGSVVGGKEAVHGVGLGVKLAVDVGGDGRGGAQRDDGAEGSVHVSMSRQIIGLRPARGMHTLRQQMQT